MDFSSFLLDAKKPAGKKGAGKGYKKSAGGGSSSTNNKNGFGSRQLKAQNSGISESGVGTKRKTGMTKR